MAMVSTLRVWMIVLAAAASSLMACAGTVASPAPSPAAAPSASPASPTPRAVESAVAPAGSASDDAWLGLLSLVPCSTPRTTTPACLDDAANGDTPARTAAVAVGEEVRISATIDNAASVTSPPITVLLFTFESPMVPAFIQAVDCGGCTIQASDVGIALQWPGVAPGDQVLTATLRAIGHPTAGPEASSQKVGDDYEWLAAFYALPASAVLGQPDGIDTSAVFALATGETTIRAR